MTLVAIISLILYGLIGLFNQMVIRTETRQVLSYLFAGIFLVVTVILVWPFEWINDYLLMLLAICIVMSMEIAHFKTKIGERSHNPVIHIFTLMLAALYVVMLFII